MVKLRKARSLSAVASSIEGDAPARALRLRRRVLRTLATAHQRGDTRVLDPTQPEGRELLFAVERPLMTAARWVGRSRRRIVVAAVAVAASAAALVAVPGVPRTLFPPNLAAGKTWKASSGIDGWPTRGVLSDEAWPMLFFHTREEASPWVVVDLGSAQRLHEVDVTNRIDCCRDRAQPLEVEVSEDESSWRRVAYRRLEFREWDASFSPTRARFVRLRVPRQSLLHLARIAVY